VVLTPGEIRTLLEGLKIRQRTLVFIAASTGIRQSELFALKWSDIDLSARTMNVARSIVLGSWGPAKLNPRKNQFLSTLWFAMLS
jgi:integrase